MIESIRCTLSKHKARVVGARLDLKLLDQDQDETNLVQTAMSEQRDLGIGSERAMTGANQLPQSALRDVTLRGFIPLLVIYTVSNENRFCQHI